MSDFPTKPIGDIPLGFSAHASDRSAQVIQIDNGKSVAAIALCAALCGICTAVTIGTVWHSNAREVETQAQIRVLKNHIDDAYNKLTVLEKRDDDTRR